MTVGITPTRAETGYGYIAAAKPIEGCDGVLTLLTDKVDIVISVTPPTVEEPTEAEAGCSICR